MKHAEIECLEKILNKITSIIQMYETGDEKQLEKLSKVAVSIAAQLNYNRTNNKNE